MYMHLRILCRGVKILVNDCASQKKQVWCLFKYNLYEYCIKMSQAYSLFVLDLAKVLMLIKILMQPLEALCLFILFTLNIVRRQKKHTCTQCSLLSSWFQPYLWLLQILQKQKNCWLGQNRLQVPAAADTVGFMSLNFFVISKSIIPIKNTE